MPETTLPTLHDLPTGADTPRPANAASVIFERARAVTAGCRWVTLGRLDQGLLHTVAATGSVPAALDAVQYLDGGPCVMSPLYGTRVEARLADSDEASPWGLLGLSAGSAGVGSVLSLPVTDDGVVVGALTLYDSRGDALEGHEQQLADLCAGLAVDGLRRAEQTPAQRLANALAPERARDQNSIDWAISLVARLVDADPADASDSFRRAATRAGMSDSALAAHLIEWLDT